MYRDKFDYPDKRYFQSHSIGLLPIGARELLEEAYLNPWARAQGDAWDHWLNALEVFRENLSPILGASPTDICQQTNVSSALTKILYSLPARPKRRKILLTEEDFPTIGHVFSQSRKFGFDVQFIPSDGDLSNVAYWQEFLTEDVHLLHLTHVFSNRAFRPPVEQILAAARDAEIFTVLDVAQSAGAIPVLLDNWQPDFATGTSVKYLCGGPGAAFLWANPKVIGQCKPIDVGWFSHKQPYTAPINNFEFSESAQRFLGGTPSVAPFVLASAGAKILSDVGVDKIFGHNQKLIERLLAAIPEDAVLPVREREFRGTAVLVKPRDLTAASRVLETSGIVHDQRMGGLRLSVHLYNSEDEIDFLCETLLPCLD